MVDTPEKIRVAQDSDGFWTCREAVSGSQEYVRADLVAELDAENEWLKHALEAANKRADEAEARRKCYECGSEMTACAQCNPELPTAELTALRARVAELEAGGCARDQGTTQYCAEAVALQKRVAELEGALMASLGHMVNAAIDLDTGATKKTALDTINGGVKLARKALAEINIKKEPGND